MLSVKNVTKYYGKFKAVDNLSFTVKPGEIFGLLGENGAGKTTTFRMIIGLLEASEGEITFNKEKIDYKTCDKISFVTEERSLLTKLTVEKMLKFYGILKSMDEKTIDKQIDYWLEEFNIKDYKYKLIKELSKGNQQKIQVISALINNPKLLILDEPFSGLDPINVKLIKKAIKKMQKEGCTIIFSSHQMQYIEDFCEKMLILVKGKAIVSGKISDIKKDYAKKTIVVKADNLKARVLTKIDGVLSCEEKNGEITLQVAKDEIADEVFNVVKKYKVHKFTVDDASLNDIFIHYVGGAK